MDQAAPIEHPQASAAAKTLFTAARTASAFTDEPVSDDTLRELHALASLGPTSGNCSPARFLFLREAQSKQRLRSFVSAGNADRILSAPVVAIVAVDPFFYDRFETLCPDQPQARDWFADSPELADATARRNTTLQGAWLIMAARALGLDCAPMSGFDNRRVDDAFLHATGWRSDFLVCLGHAASGSADDRPRAPRLPFDEACRLL